MQPKLFLTTGREYIQCEFYTRMFLFENKYLSDFLPSNTGIHSSYLKTSQAIKKVSKMTCPKLQEISQRSQILSRVQIVHSFYCFSKICSNLIAKGKLRKIVYLIQKNGSQGQISISNLFNDIFFQHYRLPSFIMMQFVSHKHLA